MAAIQIQCPQCTQPMSVDSDWLNSILECPYCRKKFQLTREVIDQKPFYEQKTVHARVNYDTKDKFRAVKIITKILLVLAVLGGIAYGCYWFFKVTPESLKGNQVYAMTRKRNNRDGAPGMCDIAKADFFPNACNLSYFFYRDATFTNIYLERVDHEQYSGTVTFTRNRHGKKELTRPIFIDRRNAFTYYRFPFDYREHPEYLEEDGDLIFELATQVNKKLKGWSYVSGTASGDILTCKIKNGGSEKEIKLRAEQISCKDDINRIWVQILTEL